MRWPGNSPPWTTSRRDGPGGMWSPRGMPSRARTSAAVGFLPQDQRYGRAKQFMLTTWELFDSWHADEIVADQGVGYFPLGRRRRSLRSPRRPVRISGHFNVPRSPQGRPVILQAGDSDEGREFAARNRRRHLHPPQQLRQRAGLLRRRKGPTAPATDGGRTTWPSCRPPPSCWLTPIPRPRSCRGRSENNRSAEPPP